MKNIKYYTRENQYGNESSYAEFNGIEFYKHGEYYFNHKYDRMHRYIYSYFFGEIPANHDIHHIDHIKTNNNINNLQMLTRKEHIALHNKGKNNPMYGTQRSDETKNKISNARKGKKHSDETKNKISKAHKGKNNPMYKQRTSDMYEDVKNGMGPADFMRKHNCSDKFFYTIKKEIAENAI